MSAAQGIGGGRARLVGDAVAYLVLAAGAAFTLAPFVLSVMTAVKSPQQFASEPVLSLPQPVTGDNFATLFGGRYDFVSPVVVTAQVVGVILVGQLVFSVLAAYAFARLRFPGRDALFCQEAVEERDEMFGKGVELNAQGLVLR